MRRTICLWMLLAMPVMAQEKKWEFSIGYSTTRASSTFESETFVVPGQNPETLKYCTAAGEESFGPNFQQFFCERKGMNGFDLAATWNVHRYVGIKGNVSSHFKKESFVDIFEVGPGETFTADVETKDRITMLLAGVQLRDNQSSARFRPFAHALAGAARQTAHFRLPGAFDASAKETSFAMKVGGGVDVRLTDRIDLRLIEVNYNPLFAGERPLKGEGIDVPITVNGRTANNWTVGFGFVVH